MNSAGATFAIHLPITASTPPDLVDDAPAAPEDGGHQRQGQGEGA
jgi:hypothetical protein